MATQLIELFEDEKIKEKIQKRLPFLFHIADIECTRGGRVGMEVGCVRERILVALLIYKFGEHNVNVPSTISPELDVRLFGEPISVKAAIMRSSRKLGAFKLKWTVNGIKAHEFANTYFPECDLLMAQIRWNKRAGGLYYVPKEVQQRVFAEIGPDNYIKLPKPGTNPRGIEITSSALGKLVEDPLTKHLPMDWQISALGYSPYQRWLELWRQD
ncbi:MAG: ThaI family type II restriction endonuclease [Thermoguttaceae bacterium]|nr:ThaI family type II restriction endonuclease [Thermoguttaceae bacterium]